MVVGFVNSGVMSLAQAVGVIMGANIGTQSLDGYWSLKSVNMAYHFLVVRLLCTCFQERTMAVLRDGTHGNRNGVFRFRAHEKCMWHH